MYRQFGGSRFYEYHTSFSRKAEQYESQGISVDWSASDTKLYMTTFAGLRTTTCQGCDSTDHTTSFCPLNVSANKTAAYFGSKDRYNHSRPNIQPTTSTNSYAPSKMDRHGRSRIYHNGKEICNNFNGLGCSLNHKNGNLIHVCEICNHLLILQQNASRRKTYQHA